MNFKAGDLVIYTDPNDPIGGTGVYIIDSIKGDQVKLTPMCGSLRKIKAKISQIEKP